MSDWIPSARAALHELARSKKEFTSDEVCDKVGRPTNPNELGMIFREAKVAGIIRQVGSRPSDRPERHGSAISVWVGGPQAFETIAAFETPDPSREPTTSSGRRWRCMTCKSVTTTEPASLLLDTSYGSMSCSPCGYKRRVFHLEGA